MNLEFLRQFCMLLPGATEDIKYGTDLCYSVGGKIFLGTRITGPFRTGIKCNEDDFAVFTERDGVVPMPRLATRGWIRIEKENALSRKEWERCIKLSYDNVVASLPRKKREDLRVKS